MVFSRALSRANRSVFRRFLGNNQSSFDSNNSLSNIRYLSTSRALFADRFFTKKHEWVSVDGKIGTIGISDYAQDALGDLVYVQLPDVDTVLKQKDECGALESVKAASEIFSPISGRVVEKNTEVENTPSLINKSCYDKGWLFKIEVANEEEIKELLTEEDYKKFLKTEVDH